MIHLVGWFGTFLVLASHAQMNMMRLRQIGLVANMVLVAFNSWLGIWSNVALGLALTLINAQRLWVSRSAKSESMANTSTTAPLPAWHPALGFGQAKRMRTSSPDVRGAGYTSPSEIQR